MNKLQRRQEGVKRAKRVLRAWRGRWIHKEDDSKLAQRLVHTRVPCSCGMCGNPRRHFGERTIQERKADYEYREETIREQELE